MDNAVRVLAASVDRLAVLNATIKQLEDEKDAIKAALLSAGPDEIVGTLHKAVITHSIRESLDSAKVRDMLTPAQYAKCTRSQPVHAVRVYGL